MRSLNKITCLLLATGLTSCTKSVDVRTAAYEKVNMQNAPSDLFLPRALWEEIEELPKESEHHEAEEGKAGGGGGGGGEHGGGGGGDGKSVTLDAPGTMAYVPVTVRLLEETPGALKGRNLELVFGKGGGTLDLASYVEADVKSDFLFGVDVPGLAEASRVQVYFLNNGRPRRFGEQVFGVDCNTYLDLSTYFRTQIAGKGHRVTALRKLYMNLMVGSYVIAFQSEGRWSVTQLTITDSRFPELLCRKEMDSSGT